MSRIFCFGLWLGLLSSTSFAQLGGLEELYGEGVHRYFANNLVGADEVLSQVIDAGSTDPRVYYFRGLVHECLGTGGEADFESGARLEAEGKGKRPVDVGNALSRVQGHVRTKIETARRDARIQVEQQQLLLEQARRSQIEARAKSLPPAPASNASPFPTESMPADDTGLAPLTPATPPAPASDTSNPFGDDAAPAADAPAADDPFGAPAAETPAAAPATGAPEADDPFGAPAAEAPATAPPAADAPAADDPFGAPAAETPATAPPAADDPFGGNQ